MRTDPSFIARGCTHHTILPSFLPALQSNAVDTSLWRMIPFFLFLFGSSLCCDVTVWKVAEGLIANRRNPRNETPDPTHAELPFSILVLWCPLLFLLWTLQRKNQLNHLLTRMKKEVSLSNMSARHSLKERYVRSLQ
jgi:hypothetical protein